MSQAQRGRAVVWESFMGDNRGWLGMECRQCAGLERIRPERGLSAMVKAMPFNGDVDDGVDS